ncbi:DNA-binding storekeeper protein-related transcriptional regulator [Raphanus sativus]|uniref:GLABROUS1 enhancer-binding protein-like 1 n=1 Tax=Raphanus sativus TaxID=3726 RepID=A0A6J0NRB2_RAPSA|nr:GLABROUS1 enhancer-binding protein-like 1 [Raphanus sativus]KAJ4893211.1 DNA-binding storekeeper protein-related transcriptional regulator [Raphanus sativus]
MATTNRLNCSDTCLPKSPSEDVSRKKKKNKSASPLIKRIWNEDDELSILKGLVDYRVNTRHDPSFDWDGFFRFVQGSIHVKFSKEQLFSKVRKLRRKFALHMERIDRGEDPLFTRLTDSQAFGYSNMIWGVYQPEVAANDEKAQEEEAQGGGIEKSPGGETTQSCGDDEQMDNAVYVNDNGDESSKLYGGNGTENVVQIENGFRETGRVSNDEPVKDNGRVGNNEPVNENGAEEDAFDGKSLYEVGVDKTTDGKESHDDDADELRVVEDAFETTILQGLSVWQRKLQLKKLMMNLGTEKRKELSNEWKALCSEETKLKIKKLRFTAKLVEAAYDG